MIRYTFLSAATIFVLNLAVANERTLTVSCPTVEKIQIVPKYGGLAFMEGSFFYGFSTPLTKSEFVSEPLPELGKIDRPISSFALTFRRGLVYGEKDNIFYCTYNIDPRFAPYKTYSVSLPLDVKKIHPSCSLCKVRDATGHQVTCSC